MKLVRFAQERRTVLGAREGDAIVPSTAYPTMLAPPKLPGKYPAMGMNLGFRAARAHAA